MKKQALLMLLALALVYPGNAQDDRQGLVPMLERFVTQLDLAIQQAAFGASAVTVEEARVQSRQVLNLAVGEGDTSFDSAIPRLGDGVGLNNYARRLLRFVEEIPELREYKVTAGNIAFFSQAASELLKASFRIQNAEELRRQIHIAQGLLLAARGAPGDLPSEGGVRTILTLFPE